VLAAAQLADTGEPDEDISAPIRGARLPTGWYVIWFSDIMAGTPQALELLSARSTALCCQIEEHSMMSVCEFYRYGQLVWLVHNDPSKGRADLTVQGRPPDPFDALRLRALLKQEAYDVAVDLASAITGFTHDQWKFEWGEPLFTRLEAAPGTLFFSSDDDPRR
jgi:hypothetical protein